MRSLEESQSRWAITLKQAGSFADLQRAVKYNGPSSPCVAGCRSVCWKTFLLFHDASTTTWSTILADARNAYGQRRDHFLKYIKHPEELATVALDPLADDPDSPWNTLRQDETVRAEIAQDVRRLPDEAFYHEERVQTMIIDVLFIYCKLNPNDGGYRQGMHELLAPIVHVIDQDALDREISASESADAAMADMLDAAYIEHDAFALFSKIMDRAKSFYEITDSISKSAVASASKDRTQTSAIVERSKYIHEVCLAKIDPELSAHLKNVEILPQIFLIRWIRLLFGREFPFDQLLVLWDTIFAVDPSLDLIDLICVSMLVRIRWNLLEADYSVCLQLLLKYPPPQQPHGPHTFVDDAVYLRNHLNSSGGATLIMKYTGKMPTATSSALSSRPTTPTMQGLAFRQLSRVGRSPLPSPSRFLQQQGGMEAVIQGATKGVLERGEKLGINQAVRDAMGEIRRNVQGFQEARYSPRTARQLLAGDTSSQTVAALEKRNRQLAGMLDETLAGLRSLAVSDLEDKVKTLELVELAVAKVQFVKVYLEDVTMEVPDLEPAGGEVGDELSSDVAMETNAVASPVAPTAKTAADAMSALSLAEPELGGTPQTGDQTPQPLPDAMEISQDTSEHSKGDPKLEDGAVRLRPPAPNPTRSTIAQSSFSWMLEPDQSASSSTPPSAPAKSLQSHRKRPSANASRERNAFLFGEVVAESDDQRPISTDEIFGLEPMRKPKAPL